MRWVPGSPAKIDSELDRDSFDWLHTAIGPVLASVGKQLHFSGNFSQRFTVFRVDLIGGPEFLAVAAAYKEEHDGPSSLLGGECEFT